MAFAKSADMQIRIGDVWYNKRTGERFTVEWSQVWKGVDTVALREIVPGKASPPEGMLRVMNKNIFLVLYLPSNAPMPRSIYEDWRPSCDD